MGLATRERYDLMVSKHEQIDRIIEFSKEFSVQMKNVSLNVEKFDAIQEGGKVPGQKITLKTKGLVKDPKLKQKSLSKIVSFKSQKHPKATPEVLIIGYWN